MKTKLFTYKGCRVIVSDDGRVWNAQTMKELKIGDTGRGYKIVDVYQSTHHWFPVHRLVATAFIPNPHNYPCINHKDNNPANNHVDNLEWCTHKYNSEYSSKQGRQNGGNRHKRVICEETSIIYPSLMEVSRQYKCNVGQVYRSCNDGVSIHGYHFKYIDNECKPSQQT